ncbi:N-acetylmuramoyl-L-alanine amidase [Robertmurraya siralis]|uniref:N-acetylmuramoyl-L-alanine amidase n=1 Tax=Robertmurraya siralis TaxID=77777 RepID=A0A919WLC7_9BACI|nr:N-acetylmuramoyl-L-alanine amidase [Robertmurraya siralis]GIN64120.1 N-acetylmuramoyl-L-alanine amidase [Robertmurraya siralis]
MKKTYIAILLALAILPLTVMNTHAALTFKDVGTTHRAQASINYLAEGGIVTGDSNGNFLPDKTVTRAEAAAMIGRAVGLNGTQRTTRFPDVASQSFASGYIQSAVDAKIISGYSDGTFKPNNPVTRGEMALLISRAFNYNATTTASAASALMSRGIAQGITANDFGYNANIKRSDFAVFLARSINYKLRLSPQVSFNIETEVTASSLNIRKGPSTAYGTVGGIPQGTKVQGAYIVGDWMYIRTSTLEGFAHRNYLNGDYIPGDNDGSSIASQMIIIDPGHGGTDPGATGLGIREKDVVLDTGLKVRALLNKTPFKVTMTRQTDVFISLAQRVQIANSAKGNIFVSIHANAFNGTANGSETYYYSAAANPHVADSKLLATKIQNRLIEAWKLSNRGVKNGNFHVLRENNMPAVLVELGFIDNAKDNEKLKSPEWRQKAAEAIFYGILDYYKEKGFDVNSYYSIK